MALESNLILQYSASFMPINAPKNPETLSDSRLSQMVDWLNAQPIFAEKTFNFPRPASSDASFRRYFRVQETPNPERAYIVMDAPPEKENCRPFVRVASQLAKLGACVPTIYAQDLTQGFLLLEDFGQITFYQAAEQAVQAGDEQQVDQLYRQALDALVHLQSQANTFQGQAYVASLPPYDADLLRQEMNLFSDWWVGTHLGQSFSSTQRDMWQQTQQYLIENALSQPQAYVLRDYHSRNLMVLNKNDTSELGILDFQDAVCGPLTYDAISLLRDCYVRWPSEQVKEWQRYYFLALVQAKHLAHDQWSDFVKQMDLMGVQRHLKAVGIFARLAHRDGKAGYLQDIPNTVQYLLEAGENDRTLLPFMRWLENDLLPAMEVSKCI